MQSAQRFEIPDQARQVKIADVVVKAIKETHTITATAEAKSKNARTALLGGDKHEMWIALQCYLRNYRDFINETSWITNVCVYSVTPEYYEQVTTEDLRHQLKIVIGFVYLKEAANSASKDMLHQVIKKALQKSGLLTDQELAKI